MPIYEYQCNACGHTMEAFQSMSEAPLKECPKCNKASLQKLVSAAGFQLKGTGWYATDFKNKGKSDVSATKTENTNTTTETKSDSTTSSTTSETKTKE